MKDHISEYKKSLEKEIMDCMSMPVSDRSTSRISAFVDCWNKLCDMYSKMSDHTYNATPEAFTAEDAMKWNHHMVNTDGTSGGHWTVDQTNNLAQSLGVDFSHITADEWNVAANMMYSDYYSVASAYGVSTPNFYGEMAKAFLFDQDGPKPAEKLSAYYHGIVCPYHK